MLAIWHSLMRQVAAFAAPAPAEPYTLEWTSGSALEYSAGNQLTWK